MTLVKQPLKGLNARPIMAVLGLLVMLVGICMLPSALLDAELQKSDWVTFVFCSAFTTYIGGLLFIPNVRLNTPVTVKQSYLLSVLAWIILPFFIGLPYILSPDVHRTLTQAYFEAMSGITTTGATIFSHVEQLSPGILLWRSISQWLGGVGIVVTALSILPIVGVGGMSIFRIEFANELEKARSTPAQIALIIIATYAILTTLSAIAYYLAGMTAFDAINHALTSLATGGFSTHTASVGYYSGIAVHLVAVMSMIVASLPFLVFYHLFFRLTCAPLFKDLQVRGFLSILLPSVALAVLYAWFRGYPLTKALDWSLFSVTSVLSGTGFAITGYDTWGPMIVPLMITLSLIGGSAGSSACGMKIFRVRIMLRTFRHQFSLLSSPETPTPLRYGKEKISGEVLTSVFSVLIGYVLAFLGVGGLLTITGLDVITSFSAAAGTLGNVGPGLGPIVGPEGNYATLSSFQQWVLTCSMLLGRLEILAVVLLFSRKYWETT